MSGMVPWPTARVGECLASVSMAGRSNVQSKDYRPAGRFPVVDQGQSEIAGWTDNDNAVVREPLPVVIFGDHTRTLKYVDYPFARGADGTQVLKPIDGIDTLYFYYACRALRLPARGYNRHFSLLKDQVIGLPPKSEQILIARTLRLVDHALRIARQIFGAELDLKRAAIRELFSRGLLEDPQKETEIGPLPKSWVVAPLGDVAFRPDYGHTASAQREAVGPRFLRITDIQDGNVSWDSVPYCDGNAAPADKRLQELDIVVARIGGTTGKAFLISGLPCGEQAIFASYLIRLRARPEVVDPRFLYYYLQTEQYWHYIGLHKPGRLKGGINIPVLVNLPIPLPTLTEQRDLVAVLVAIDKKLGLVVRRKAALSELFQTLLRMLMTGEICVSDLDLSELGGEVAHGMRGPAGVV